ncbi:MAG: hypothetical protein ACRCZP_12640, partial [Phycicoccus sp.]
ELLASVRDLVYSAADALKRAQDEMPAAVAVPALSGVASALSGAPSTAATTLWDSLTPDQQMAVADELRQHAGSTQAAGAARSRAVQIMNELAVHYLDVEDSVPALPVAAEPPRVPTDAAAANTVATSLDATGSPLPGLVATGGSSDATLVTSSTMAAGSADQPGPTLFRDMYAAGALAASAAVLGRFRLGSAWLEKRRKDKEAKEAAAGSTPAGTGSPGIDTPATGASSGAPLPELDTGGAGGIGSGGAIGAGGGGIGGPAVDPPNANSVLTGGVVGAGAAAGVASAGLVAPGVGSVGTPGTGTGMGMMPPMMPPMTGAEGGGMGRRIPPWLVETEPVFGESVPVTQTVIGAELEEPR